MISQFQASGWMALRFKFLKWRLRHISNRNFLMGLSILVGLVCGLAAVLLKNVVHRIQDYLQYSVTFEYHKVIYFILPLIGILLTSLIIKRFLNGKLGRGLGPIIENITRRGSRIEQHKTWSHLATSAVTAGFGGSAGLEAPIVVTGSAIGSNIGLLAHLNYRERTLLLGCGAAAGISAVFNCPIAGVIFAFEVLLEGFTVPAFIPLLLSSATAAVVSRFFYSDRLFYLITDDWAVSQLPFYTLLGFLCGLVSVYMTRTTLKIEARLGSWKSLYGKAIVGGLSLGTLIFLLPPLYGEGYTAIQNLLNGNYTFLMRDTLLEGFPIEWTLLAGFAALIVVFKVIAAALTIASGGNGGIFAPSLFTGSMLGFSFSYSVNQTGFIQLPVTSFVATAMAGILSGVVHAPLTGIFLIAEITGGYNLFVPLMIVSASSFFIARLMEPYSVYTKKLAKKGLIGAQKKDNTVLRAMRLKSFVRKSGQPLSPNTSLGELVALLQKNQDDYFPVLNEKQQFLGMVQLDKNRELLFNAELYQTTFVRDFMFEPPFKIAVNENLESVFKKLEDSEMECLPVLDQNIFGGFIFKSELLEGYRHKLIRQSRELS
jgi:CIC family chloride channel protein